MRTILITIFHGAAAKNILRTNVIKALLKEPDCRVICLMRFPDRADLYRKEMPHEQIVYDAFYEIPVGVFERVFSFLKFRLIKTATTDLRHRVSYSSHRNFVKFFVSLFFNWFIARPSIRKFFRLIDYYFISDPGFRAVLKKYNPDTVVLTNLFDDGETALLREAKKMKISTIGYVNSWDKLTARSSVRILPDSMIVFNEIIKKEAIEHADMPAERIAVCGIPQYDRYVAETSKSRSEFFRKMNLDPAKHLVVYSPLGIRFWDSDWAFIDFFHEIISDPNMGLNCQLLVRFPPNDFLNEEELKKRPWLKYELPGRRFGQKRSVDWDMDFSELEHLADMLAYMSVYVGYTSSFAIDAAIFDKPIIGINFKLKENLPLSVSPTEHYKTDHFSKALRAGGIRLVESKEMFIDVLKAYLKDFSTDRDGRKRLVEEQCGKLDGKSGERVAKTILKKS